MTVKRVFSAFTKALKGKGFVIEESVARSSDGSVRIELGSEDWTLYIDDTFVMTHKMEAGSMAALIGATRRQGKQRRQLSKTVSVPRKRTLDRFSKRLINRSRGLDVTIDQQKLHEAAKSAEVSAYAKNGFLLSLKGDGFRDVGVDKLLWEPFCLSYTDTTWKLYKDGQCKEKEDLIGEGIISDKGYLMIRGIINRQNP